MTKVPEREQRLLYALGQMCSQYLGAQHDGREALDHMCMGAGEEAFKALQAYGLIEIEGRGATWTNAGLELLDLPLNQRRFPK